jgi:hypothetical protein
VNRAHIYVLSALLAAVGLGVFAYKAWVMGFPLSPATKATVWNVEVRVKFEADNRPAKVNMFIPGSTSRYVVADEHFISGGFGFVVAGEDGNRRVTWSARKARGRTNLYYQGVIRAQHTSIPLPEAEAEEPARLSLEGPKSTAAKALLEDIRAKSADTPSMASALIRRLNRPQPDENVNLLLGPKRDMQRKARLAVNLLRLAGVQARQVNGIRLQKESHDFSRKTPILSWLEVYHNDKWISFNPDSGEQRIPNDWLAWWRGPKKLADLEGGSKLRVSVFESPKVEEGIASAVRKTRISKPLLLRFSLFSLPVHTQAVYRVMLLVPVGAVVLAFLRNMVGIKTFGTFMPVLIALSFRETGLLHGIGLFVILVALGLAVRFYLDRLKLLLVPRLAAVLVVVVGLMAITSIISHALGVHTGLSVAIFPMVILTMTIERMSILWEERGPREALVTGLGSLAASAVAFVVMNIKYVEHLIFVFPEVMLVMLAVLVLLGRYTGYRLADLLRFRELARE